MAERTGQVGSEPGDMPRLAAGPGRDDDASTDREADDRGVGFRIGSAWFATPVVVLTGVHPLPEMTPVPGTSPWLLGAANAHGRLLPIVDLRRFAYDLPLTRGPAARVLELERGGVHTGLAVDEVSGLARFDWLAPVPEGLEPCERLDDCLVGGAEGDGRRCAHIDLDRLLRRRDFLRPGGRTGARRAGAHRAGAHRTGARRE